MDGQIKSSSFTHLLSKEKNTNHSTFFYGSVIFDFLRMILCFQDILYTFVNMLAGYQ